MQLRGNHVVLNVVGHKPELRGLYNNIIINLSCLFSSILSSGILSGIRFGLLRGNPRATTSIIMNNKSELRGLYNNK